MTLGKMNTLRVMRQGVVLSFWSRMWREFFRQLGKLMRLFEHWPGLSKNIDRGRRVLAEMHKGVESPERGAVRPSPGSVTA